jgi:CDP-paratose 2-epimerase
MDRAMARIERTKGTAFNMGGGPDNTVSLLEMLELVGLQAGRRPEVGFGPWRVGDQRWYVSDTRRFQQLTGWSTQTRVAEGVERLCSWLRGRQDDLAVAEAG